uniref:Uncharacterized protein n=1 Tax=Gossypium raimondii TaxID=29730 RepID=A0A0D2T5V8_GOSRA|nr:hypothetical protein B456_011G102000 [Gossypium raimondii]
MQLNLIPVSVVNNCEYGAESSSSFPSIPHSSSKEAFYRVIRSWASKKFMTGCQLLYQILCWLFKFSAKESMILNLVRQLHSIQLGFIHFVDGFFSPIYKHLGISIFGLGFVTSITFIFIVGVFMSSWLGASVLSLGEWLIKKMPLICYIYSASKQISTAISPEIGEYAFGFITSTVILHGSSAGSEELNCVYVPSNHLYIGDMFLISSNDIVRPNLSVREGIEVVNSGGMSVPRMLTTLDECVN